MKKLPITTLIALLGCSTFAKPADDSISALVTVGSKGQGNEAASLAWPKVAKLGPERLPDLLSAMDKANGIGQNWLRAAVDTIAENSIKKGKKLPASELEKFLKDSKHSPAARRLAFELLQKSMPGRAAKLVPSFINDPAPQLRRDAVKLVLDDANAESEKESACNLFDKALRAARDVDQIQDAVKALRERGREVDLPKVMGFLMRWKVIGPFDNTDRKGFGVPYPPEKKIDYSASYKGKEAQAKWTAFATSDEYGMVDVNLEYGELKEVVAYAHSIFESPEAKSVQFRLGCKNAWKIWLNGKLLFARDEYHRGMRIDQYSIDANLKKGKNEILVKLCQNEQKESWTKQWQFQLRVTDSSGTAVLASNRGPTPKPSPKKR